MPRGGAAGQLFDYRHNEDNGYGDTEVSRIPNDCIEFGGRTYIQYTSVFTWDPPAGWDGSLMSGVAYSDDHGVTWHDYPYHWSCSCGSAGFPKRRPSCSPCRPPIPCTSRWRRR
ncbi:DUF4185 domain-containing protein [Streptomyces sp. NPDC001373]|uniref:DUF4185 domain-containing protein n=1 Tax=Streptomyces sp. NPDC001373 TaxID=3364565 RepID=UPI0036B7B1D9